MMPDKPVLDCINYMDQDRSFRMRDAVRPGRKKERLWLRDIIPDSSDNPLEALINQGIESDRHREKRQGPEITAENKRRFKRSLFHLHPYSRNQKGALDDRDDPQGTEDNPHHAGAAGRA
jgi:hypothetical protein